MSTVWKMHRVNYPALMTGVVETVLRNERDSLEATIFVRNTDDVQIRIKPVAGSRANRNHAIAEAARLAAMCFDTLGDTEHNHAKDPREDLLECSVGLQQLTWTGLLVRGRDAVIVVMPCFKGVVDTLMARYF